MIIAGREGGERLYRYCDRSCVDVDGADYGLG